MSPVFSSLRQAGGFVLLVLLLLLSPVLIPPSLLPSRETIYNSTPWNVGPYPFIHDQIYNEKSDIDIAIVGDSQIWAAIDTPYLQQEMSRKLGRPAVVVTLCCPWAGFDGLYFLVRDLLAHRKVHMLVFSDASGLQAMPQETPHKQAWRWFRYAEDSAEIAALPFRVRATYYYGSILGMPHTLLSLLRPNLGPLLTPRRIQELEEAHHWIMPDTRLGALTIRIGYNNDPARFAPYTPATATAQPSDFEVYSPQTAGYFRFEIDPSSTSLQTYFARKLAALAAGHGTAVVCLDIPFYPDRQSVLIRERYNWAVMMRQPVTLVGIPPASLFAGIPGDDIAKLYWDPFHFNENGQQFYTRLLAPDLVSIYDDTTKN